MKALASRSILTLCCLLLTTPALAKNGSPQANATRPTPSSQGGSQRVSPPENRSSAAVARPVNPGSSAGARPVNPRNSAVTPSGDRVESPRPSTRFAANRGVQRSENSQRGLNSIRTRGRLAARRQNEVADRDLPETAATGPGQRQNGLPRAGMESPNEAMARGLRNRLAQIERMRDKAIETDNPKLLDLADHLDQDARQKFTEMSERIAQRQASGKPGVGAPLRKPTDNSLPAIDPPFEPIPTEPVSEPFPTELELDPIPTDPELEPLPRTGAEVPPLDAEPVAGDLESLPTDQP